MTQDHSALATPPVPMREAWRYWLRLGLISFGGPAGQIAIMHRDLVEEKGWISENRFLHALNYCMVLPGPEAQQLATYIGWLMHGRVGGLVAGGLFVLPSFFILVALAWIYMAYGATPVVTALLYGIKPAIVAIILHAAWRMGKRTLRNGMLWALSMLAFIAIALFHVPFPAIVVSAALFGYVGSLWYPHRFDTDAPCRSQKASGAAGDDIIPSRAHSRFGRSLASGVAIWMGAMLALLLVFGWSALFTQVGWFFTKAALLTFGGAYAVLPYVFSGAVDHYQWLTAGQMLDGLALGETTPGPLIMVVTFVGFVGGWGGQAFGSEYAWLSAVLAAAVATFFTFLPSFVFIFAGAPLIESAHGNLRLTAPLTAITAAVVGVIANLAVFFAMHVFYPPGKGMDLAAVFLALIAVVALFRFRFGSVAVIATCATAGLAYSLYAGAIL